ncbi:F-box/LRR-repeat protein 4-like [Gastrolobium bilobum]|uniref:F-box/LRR-repeat protein 4-like n=1 Tax=Gastrolobium bilobum TaxID=150636 RepID=UPI002AAFCC8F|nr:F-box/LRR-repeat protein 4-like [Gastrolobium bilobum]
MLHLPDECWELVFRFMNHHRYFDSLSLVSKQFLSITNRLRFSLTICDPTLPFLPRLFHRFPTLTSLDLTRFRGDLDALLHQISRSSLHLKSLNLSHHPTIPSNGLRSLAKKMKTLNSLSCSNMGSLKNADLLLIADFFPFLEELDLSFPKDCNSNNFTDPVSDFGVKALSLALPKLRKVNLSGNYFINNPSLFSLCKNCEFLQEIVIFECHFITQAGIASAIRERPSLSSLRVSNFGIGTKKDFIGSLVSLKSLTCLDFTCSSISDELLCSVAEEALPLRKLVLQGCCNYSYAGIFCLLSKCQFVQHLDLQNAEFLNDQRVAELSLLLGNLVSINVGGCRMLTNSTFFALARNCPLLNEIQMEVTDIGKRGVKDSFMDFVVNPQVKSLHLAHNSWLRDESIKMLASVCPNLQLLDLSYCCGISEGIVEVLRRCCKIRELSLAFCKGVKLFGMNFEVPKLEVLNLSWSGIDDEALYVISKSCCGLVHLDLENCSDVTAKGVRQVVKNCTQLREINLESCYKVAGNVVAWMVFSRPSLRKIMAPPRFRPSDSQRELFLRHGCLVC